MSLEDVTQKARDRVGEDAGIRKSLKVDLGDDGIIFLDGRQVPNTINNEDGDADVTLRCSLKTFQGILDGETNPQMAFMMGKIKIDGDMGIAMQFAKALG